MGYGAAADMAQYADLHTALVWHLQSNHYPPVPVSMVPVCLAAIDAINEGEFHRAIDLPDNILWRNESAAPAWAIVEGHHLEPFIDSINEDDEYLSEFD